MFLTLQQLLLIALLHQQQQLASHGAWATRTTATRAATPPATQPPTAVPLAAAPLVSSSEATLLTTHRLFPAPQMQPLRRYEDTNEVGNGPAVGAATAPEQLTAAVEAKADGADGGGGGNKRYSIVSVYTNCTRDLFAMNIELNRGFRGLVYAKDFPLECRARGTAHTNVTLRLPTSGCGVRVEPRADGNMELSVRVMLQMELKLRQSSDILRTVRCKLPPNAMGMMVIQLTTTTPVTTTTTESTRPNVYEGVGPQNYRNGRMRVLATNTVNATAATAAAAAAATATGQSEDVSDNSDTSSAPQTEESNESQILQQTTAAIPPSQQQQQQQQQRDESQTTTTIAPKTTTAKTTATPRVRIWLELGGLDGSGAVEVGQPTTLTVRAIVPGTMGVRVVDCAALDGLGESKQQLLDERGCTIDEQVMPPLSAHFRPAEEGWSKQQVDDLVEKIFSATFPAFKFPDRERLHVSCGVQLCKGKCPNVNCRTTEKLNLSADKHLARIEVFNSLAVTAPQIEVDRLRYDRHYNMSVEEYPPHVRPVQSEGTLCLSVSKLAISFCVLGLIFLLAVVVAIFSLIRSRRRAALACTLRPSDSGGRLQRAEVCTSMFSSSSESAHSARFGSKLFIPYYPNTLPYGRVY